MTTQISEKPQQAEVSRVEHTRTGPTYRPNVDILETPDELTVLADVPGAGGDDIDIQFENGSLTIHARTRPRQGTDVRYRHCEYGIGDFHRTFQVSEHVDATRIFAELSAGVLTLHLPKVEAVKPRKIDVRVQ